MNRREHEAWCEALCLAPSDWRLRLVMADALEDSGEAGYARYLRQIAMEVQADCRLERLANELPVEEEVPWPSPWCDGWEFRFDSGVTTKSECLPVE